MTDIVERLRSQITDGHSRGCEGRCYSCDCGYDLIAEGLLEMAADEIERLRNALETADDLISELANKFYSIDPYTRGGTTEAARSDLAAIDKVKAQIRSAFPPSHQTPPTTVHRGSPKV